MTRPDTTGPGPLGAGSFERALDPSKIKTRAEAAAIPAQDSRPLDVNGIVAELMGVEAHLDEARERLIKATNTLAALARGAP